VPMQPSVFEFARNKSTTTAETKKTLENKAAGVGGGGRVVRLASRYIEKIEVKIAMGFLMSDRMSCTVDECHSTDFFNG
jgi:hypothetical protein